MSHHQGKRPYRRMSLLWLSACLRLCGAARSRCAQAGQLALGVRRTGQAGCPLPRPRRASTPQPVRRHGPGDPAPVSRAPPGALPQCPQGRSVRAAGPADTTPATAAVPMSTAVRTRTTPSLTRSRSLSSNCGPRVKKQPLQPRRNQAADRHLPRSACTNAGNTYVGSCSSPSRGNMSSATNWSIERSTHASGASAFSVVV
jgi:hypothetical protein